MNSAQLRPTKPIGGFRGGVLGFCVGFVAASMGGYMYLLEDYRKSNESIKWDIASVRNESLQLNDKFSRIDALEGDFDTLKSTLTEELSVKDTRTNSTITLLRTQRSKDVYTIIRAGY
ncbi:hypothetical protein J056_002990 [Wallemia ichthyophaga EXF-994]|uniref:Uncharacterized protein n=1 Tax=Wallemia ichthyophaga (strain EXF-994 / CBS 113033) TaxID=1299270 RepID=R9AMY7_WALI9|nr:uncharacterized protein J056_002990 [Wallemia ichthyophaga EXF-994]EOR03533.1 hypothetical protein J056_002990 [Wallemia ichthyophaga EXF-994]